MKKGKKMEKETFMDKSSTRHSVLSNILFWLRYYHKEAPVVLWLMALTIVFAPLLTMLSLFLRKVTLAVVEQQMDIKTLLIVLGGYIVVYTLIKSLNSSLGVYNNYAMGVERERIAFKLFVKSQHLKYSYIESEDGKNAYFKALDCQMQRGISIQMLETAKGTIISVLNFALYSTVLSTLNIWMVVILLLLSFLTYLIEQMNVRFYNKWRTPNAVNMKQHNCIRSSIGNVEAAKDIRIFGMAGWLKDRLERVVAERKRLELITWSWTWKRSSLISVIGLIRDLGAYAYLIYMAVERGMAASDFLLYFSAIGGFSGFVSGIANSMGGLRRLADDTDSVRNYLEAKEEDMVSGTRHISELSTPIAIEFKDVSFAYGDKELFSHFNLKIAAGEKLALVGVNGAGKTTLVKLLCGFYEPDEGQILFNGIDIREFPKAELYELFSVVFQDIFLPTVRVDESIVLQTAEDVDQDRLKIAMEKAGMAEVLKEKKIAMDRYVGAQSSKSAVDLSGGQRQRLLMARALYKDGAVMVLDEPTAALDPIAESEVYEAYQRCSQGKTSIFISHRLASTSFSDRIVLMEKGRILEMGRHEELMAQNGAYAEMFRIQSSYYIDDEESDVK